MKKIYVILSIVVLLIVVVLLTTLTAQKDEIKIGYIGAMTGSVAKYGSYEAVLLAVEEINSTGGINGKELVLFAEDGMCNPTEAIKAVNKLINVNDIKIIAGGHCTPESAAIAPVVEDNKIVMLASIITSPVLTDMGDYVFRTSPISVIQSDIVADHAYNKMGIKKIAVIYAQTDYARPIGEQMKNSFIALGGDVVLFESYVAGDTSFRTILSKVEAAGAEAIFISAQTPDSALSFMKEVEEMGLNLQLFGNDVAGMPANIAEIPELYEGFISALPDFDVENEKTKTFIEKYNKKYGTETLPYGFFTAESYDGVMILAEGIKKFGTDPEKMKEYLYSIKDYDGVSGKVTIDKNGDGVRTYSLKIVTDGKIEEYH